MKTLEYLLESPELYLPGCVAGVLVGATCALLSVIVSLKRLAFIGQGISHAAFGGMGFAAIAGLATMSSGIAATTSIAQFGIVFSFCIAAALLVGLVSGRRSGRSRTHADTAIGVVLVASMALGSILGSMSRGGVIWESFLFGSLLATGWTEVGLAAICGTGVLLTLLALRRQIMFWTFDEPAAEAFGVDCERVRVVVLILLTVATVTAMKLAGVVLATALLVLPGATALRLSSRLAPVLVWSLMIALAGVAIGMVLSFELNWAPGSCIVLALTALFAGSWLITSTGSAPAQRA
ncbi:MAG: metal ABC transporter permease [Planctomycetota bacterium]|nr:metal ABC transporter permease [Planctomycetota bacterium]